MRRRERALLLHPTVFAYGSLTVAVRFDSFFMCLMGFASYKGSLFLLSSSDERRLFSSFSCRSLSSCGGSLLIDFVSDTDRDILDTLVEHRVATAAQLSVLLEIPERTIRYRLAQLKAKGYARAVRPPADKGSSPDHWCPTRKADSWSQGERAPQGGDKAAPSTTFVEHSAAITALYVALLKATAGFGLSEWAREAGAAEEFEWRSRPRKIVPDAFMVLLDKKAAFRAFVEVDLGSMSMTRLSQKLSGYAAYYAAAGVGRHPSIPAGTAAGDHERGPGRGRPPALRAALSSGTAPLALLSLPRTRRVGARDGRVRLRALPRRGGRRTRVAVLSRRRRALPHRPAAPPVEI